MLPEQRGLFSDLVSRFRRRRSNRATGNRQARFGRQVAVENLEDRRLLVTRVWLDFGDGYATPTTGSPYTGLRTLLGLSENAIHDALVPAGAAGNFVYEEELGTLMLNNVNPPQNPYNLVGLRSYINSSLSNVVVPTDALTMEEAITAQIQRALEPYDIQVISSFNSNVRGFGVNGLTIPSVGSTDFSNVAGLEALNDTGQQFGKNDIYISFSGVFQTVNNVAFASNLPISAAFAVQTFPTPGAKPSRLDTGGVIDVNYWADRVLGPGGTGGSLNIALANAAMYVIGWDFGLSSVENGATGPYSNFSDPNVGLLNQSNAMAEGGLFEDAGIPSISDTRAMSFNNFPMMQNGPNFAPMLAPGVLGQAALLGVPQFPLPPQDTSFNLSGDGVTISETIVPNTSPFVFPDATLNEDPSVTVNTYQQLVNDPDVGANPDVAYVSGTGGFDQIFIKKISATQAQVTVNAYTDATYSTLLGDAAAANSNFGLPSTYTYTINLAKIITPGRVNDSLPFKIIVDGTTSEDQVFLDPTLGATVQVHGGADVKTLNINGNGAYNVQYTPTSPPSNNFQGAIAEIASLIPETLTAGGSGTLVITGSTTNVTTKKVNGKLQTVSTTTPFTTNVLLDHMQLDPDPTTGDVSALRLTNFNRLSYVAPGFLNNNYNVTNFVNADGSLSWQIAGQVNSPFFAPSLAGNLQFNNIKQLVIDTSKGSSSDTVSFAVAAQHPEGLQSVKVVMGSQGIGGDELDFDDSASLDRQTYLISAVSVLPVQPADSTFTGFSYSGAELVTILGPQANNNTYVVTPSTTTAFDIQSTSGSDTLAVHLAGTQYSESDDTMGTGQWTFGNRKTISFSGIQNIVNQGADYQSNPVPDNVSPVNGSSQDSNIIALAGASDNGVSKPLIQVYSAITNQLLYQFYAFEQAFKGGVRVTTADIDGDGVPDIIVAPGAGRAAEVKVYNGAVLMANVSGPLNFVNNADNLIGPGPDFKPSLMADFTVLNSNFTPFTGGLYVATGDVNGDGAQDIITSNAKGASQINVFLNQGGGFFSSLPDTTFAPYPTNMTSGIQIAAGDIDGNGTAEIVTVPNAGQIATVKEFNYADVSVNPLTLPLRQFNAFETTFRGGASITMGDLDADGVDEVILGAGQGGKSRVRVFNGQTGLMEREFQAYTTGNINAPVKVLARNIDSSGAAELFTTQAINSVTHTVSLFDPLSIVDPTAAVLTAPLVDTLMESSADLKAGINFG